MAALSRFSDVFKEILIPLIQKGIPVKTKRARKYGTKDFKDKEK